MRSAGLSARQLPSFLSASRRCSGGPAAKPFSRGYAATGTVVDAAVRVTNSNRSGAGSGTCIDYDEASGDMLVLSACHIFFDRDPNTRIDARGPAEVILFDGSKYTAPMLGMFVKESSDCALLRVHTGKRYPFVPLAEVEPQAGTKLFKVGFPAWKDGGRDVGPGTATGYDERSFLRAKMWTMSGDSGGGVFEEDGKLVGVVSGHNTQGRGGPPTDSAFCCSLTPIRNLIKKVGWKGGNAPRQGGIGNHNQIVQVFPQGSGGSQPGGGQGVTPPKLPDQVGPLTPSPTTPPIQGESKAIADFQAQMKEIAQQLDSINAKVASIKGEKGDPGPQGPAGKNGAPGPQGEKGEQGLVGKAGADGKPGPVGPAGPVGPSGPAGANGVAGKDGLNGKDVDPAIVNSLNIRISSLEAKIGSGGSKLITVPYTVDK